MNHKHSIYDTDSHFSISPITRAIKNESSKKTMVMQYDHNSERFTFEMPRYIEGHDMSLCNKVEVHYINVSSDKSGKSSNVYVINDLQVSPEDENIVICSWLISKNATMHAGTLNFLLRFVCLDEFKATYVWNTAIFKEITISSGIFNDTEEIITPYYDVLEAWKSDVESQIGSGGGKVYRHHVVLATKDNDETYMEDPHFRLEFVIYRSNDTPIESISHMDAVDMLSAVCTNSYIVLWDGPDGQAHFDWVGKYGNDKIDMHYVHGLSTYEGVYCDYQRYSDDTFNITDTITEV